MRYGQLRSLNNFSYSAVIVEAEQTYYVVALDSESAAKIVHASISVSIVSTVDGQGLR